MDLSSSIQLLSTAKLFRRIGFFYALYINYTVQYLPGAISINNFIPRYCTFYYIIKYYNRAIETREARESGEPLAPLIGRLKSHREYQNIKSVYRIFYRQSK